MAKVLAFGGLGMLGLAGFIAATSPFGDGMDSLIALVLTGAGVLDLLVALKLSRRNK